MKLQKKIFHSDTKPSRPPLKQMKQKVPWSLNIMKFEFLWRRITRVHRTKSGE